MHGQTKIKFTILGLDIKVACIAWIDKYTVGPSITGLFSDS